MSEDEKKDLTPDEENAPQNGEDTNSQGAPAESELDTLKRHAEKLHNDYLYLKADFENYKKRVIKEKSDLSKYGSESLIVALLDLVDNFERALSLEIKPENLQSFSEGVQMIASEFKNILSRFGVSELPAEGAPFDPNFHEALGTEPSDSAPAGQILKVFCKPYKLHDRLVRPGRVVIATEPNKEEPS